MVRTRCSGVGVQPRDQGDGAHSAAAPADAPCVLRLADRVELLLQAQPVERAERQADEDVDAVGQHSERVGEGEADFGFGAVAAAGSGMPQCAVIGWPGQTGQASPRRVVADGEDEIELRRARLCRIRSSSSSAGR